MWFQTFKMASIIARSRSFEAKFTDKVPLNPSNVPTKFVGITRINLEKVQKCYFRPLNGHAPFPNVKVVLRSNSWTRCPSPLSMFVPSFFGITKIELEKRAKVWFQASKLATISRGQIAVAIQCTEIWWHTNLSTQKSLAQFSIASLPSRDSASSDRDHRVECAWFHLQPWGPHTG